MTACIIRENNAMAAGQYLHIGSNYFCAQRNELWPSVSSETTFDAKMRLVSGSGLGSDNIHMLRLSDLSSPQEKSLNATVRCLAINEMYVAVLIRECSPV